METVKVYVIYYNTTYLRKAGWNGRFEWSEDIVGAKLYSSEDALKKDLSKVANMTTSFGNVPSIYPEVHVFDMTFLQKIDQSERLKKNRERAEKAAKTREINFAKQCIKDAERAVERAQRDLDYRKCEVEKAVRYMLNKEMKDK